MSYRILIIDDEPPHARENAAVARRAIAETERIDIEVEEVNSIKAMQRAIDEHRAKTAIIIAATTDNNMYGIARASENATALRDAGIAHIATVTGDDPDDEDMQKTMSVLRRLQVPFISKADPEELQKFFAKALKETLVPISSLGSVHIR